MSEGTCPDDTPFYLNGEEVLCMRCRYRGEYHVVYDGLHRVDIFFAMCHKREDYVGLPLNTCEFFKQRKQKGWRE